MGTKTLGSNANNSLTALKYLPGWNSGMAAADVATLAQLILNDQGNSDQIMPEAFSSNGLLYVPNRGVLKVLPGDWVGVDAAGWPILVSADAVADGATSWTHS